MTLRTRRSGIGSAYPTRGRVLLTGASGGIGAAIARRLAEEGWTLLLVGRREEPLTTLAASLMGGAEHHPWVVADISVPQGRAALIDVVAASGGVDVLINNAGVSGFALLDALDDERLAALFAINTVVPMALCRGLLPQLSRSPHGQIVNIGSTFGSIGFPAFSGYCASKFALRGFSQALRRELADTSVRVHYLAPRAVATDLNGRAVQELNAALGNRVDPPARVAAAVSRALASRRGRDIHLGWPERLFVMINAIMPAMVDRSVRQSLTTVRRFAQRRDVPPARAVDGDSSPIIRPPGHPETVPDRSPSP